MKLSRFLAVCVLALFPLAIVLPNAAYGSNISFSLKLYGGLNYLSGGDLNTGLQGLNDYDGRNFWFFGLTKTGGDYNPVHLGANFGGDLIIQITPAIGIGIGAGYLQGSRESMITYGPVSAGDNTTAKVSAVPLRLGVYCTLPAGKIININFNAGLSYYLARMSFDIRSYGGTSWTQYSAQADGGGLGFQGGMAIEFKVAPALSLFLEGQGRYASLGGFDGTLDVTNNFGGHLSQSGKLYFYELTTLYLGTYPGILVLNTQPSGSAFSDVREAGIDFSGFSAVAGIIIHF